MLLQDLTDKIMRIMHHKVIEYVDHGKDISVGSVLALRKVSIIILLASILYAILYKHSNNMLSHSSTMHTCKCKFMSFVPSLLLLIVI